MVEPFQGCENNGVDRTHSRQYSSCNSSSIAIVYLTQHKKVMSTSNLLPKPLAVGRTVPLKMAFLGQFLTHPVLVILFPEHLCGLLKIHLLSSKLDLSKTGILYFLTIASSMAKQSYLYLAMQLVAHAEKSHPLSI